MSAGIGMAQGAGLSIQFAWDTALATLREQRWRVLPAPTTPLTIGVETLHVK